MGRIKRTGKPNNLKVDPKALVAECYARFPKTMDRLWRAEIDEEKGK